MKINIIPTDTFQREFKHLSKKYPSLKEDLRLFNKVLILYPEVGNDLGGGIRKIRLSVKSKGKGKRGGARIITYNLIVNVIEKTFIFFIFMTKIKKKIYQDSRYKAY